MNKFRIALILIVGLSVAGLIAYTQIKGERASVVSSNFGGEYNLTTHLGTRVSDKDYKDQYRLIYFGFTYCPAICPTELQRITRVLNDLPDNISKQIQPLFVTVDPQRDDVGTMKSYVSAFHPRLTGLTGTTEEIKTIIDGYKIYAAKVKDETMTEYTMDHTSYIYFMGPDDTLIHIFKMDDSVEAIQNKVKSYF